MSELDNFVHGLSKVKHKTTIHNNEEARKEYQNLISEFSTQRLGATLKRYGSVERLRLELKLRKKAYYKKYGRSEGVRQGSCIQYTRYADDFILGIVGPRSLAQEVLTKIVLFLKSDLHLNVKESRVVNRNEKGATFLGFQVYLPSFHKKTRTQWNKFASIAKYKRRALARVKQSDARLARYVSYQLKKHLIRALQCELGERKFNKKVVPEVAYSLATKIKSKTTNNPALER